MNDRMTTAPIVRSRPMTRTGQRIRILVADDHALLRQALRMLLEAQDGLEVVGEATNGRDAVEAAERWRAGLVFPHHYGTFPVLEPNAEATMDSLRSAGIRGLALDPGQKMLWRGRKLITP